MINLDSLTIEQKAIIDNVYSELRASLAKAAEDGADNECWSDHVELTCSSYGNEATVEVEVDNYAMREACAMVASESLSTAMVTAALELAGAFDTPKAGSADLDPVRKLILEHIQKYLDQKNGHDSSFIEKHEAAVSIGTLEALFSDLSSVIDSKDVTP